MNTRNRRTRNHLQSIAIALVASWGSASAAQFHNAGIAAATIASDATLRTRASVQQVFTAPAGYNEITAMVPFQGALYVGVDNKLFRITHAGCKLQENISPDSAISRINAITEFNGALYITDWRGNVHRSSDGRKWQIVRHATSYNEGGTLTFQPEVQEMLVFNGHLYLAVGHELYRSNNGSRWTLELGNGASFPESWLDDPQTHYGDVQMSVFEGYLYVSVDRKDGGYQIWRSRDGRQWNLDSDYTSGFGMTDLEPFNAHVYGVIGNEMRLHRRNSDNQFAATYYGTGSYPGDGAGGHFGSANHHMVNWITTDGNWYPLDIPAFQGRYEAMEMIEHKGKLYLSAASPDPMYTPFLYSSSYGAGWQAVGNETWTLSGQIEAGALASWNGRIYLGIFKHGDSATVYEFVEPGESLSRCQASAIEYMPPSIQPW